MSLSDCLSNEQMLLTALPTKHGPRAGGYYLTAPQQDCWR